MGKIVVTEFVSLDGVMQAPGGGEDYKHAGWTFEISRGEEGDEFKAEERLRERAAARAGHVRGLRDGLAVNDQGLVWRKDERDAEVRRLLDARRGQSGTTRPCSGRSR